MRNLARERERARRMNGWTRLTGRRVKEHLRITNLYRDATVKIDHDPHSSTNQVRQDDSRLDGHDLSEAVERPAGVGVVGIAESVEEVGQDVVEGALADGRVQLVKSLRGGLANFR